MKHTTSTWMQLVLSHMLLPARCSSQESAIGSETSRKSSLGTTKERRVFFFFWNREANYDRLFFVCCDRRRIGSCLLIVRVYSLSLL
jgi:hypothetical protein